MENPNTPGLIVKANPFVEAKCKLDVYESRILAWGAQQIGRYDDGFAMCTLTRSDAVRLLGLDENYTLKKIRALLRKMHRHVIEIEEPNVDMGGEGWSDVSLITKSQYNSKTQEFKFRIHEDLKPYLLNLTGGNFTQLDFVTILGFRKVHTVRFYELCKKELMQSSETLFWRGLDKFKDMLGIPGKYKKYKDFEKYILTPTIEELKNIADIELEITPDKAGTKKFQMLQFDVKMIDPKKSGYWLQMRSFGLGDEKISAIMKDFGKEIVNETLLKYGKQISAGEYNNGEKMRNPAGVFLIKINEVGERIGIQTSF